MHPHQQRTETHATIKQARKCENLIIFTKKTLRKCIQAKERPPLPFRLLFL